MPNHRNAWKRETSAEVYRRVERSLTPLLRLVMQLRMGEGWSIREVADHIGYTEARVQEMVMTIAGKLCEAAADNVGKVN